VNASEEEDAWLEALEGRVHPIQYTFKSLNQSVKTGKVFTSQAIPNIREP